METAVTTLVTGCITIIHDVSRFIAALYAGSLLPFLLLFAGKLRLNILVAGV